MPIENNSLPWWLGPSKAPWEAMLEGVQAGSQIRSNQIRTRQVIAEEVQNVKRQETAATLKMLEIGMEQERNSLAVKSFQAKQDAELMRVKGMSLLGEKTANAVKNGKLGDQEVRADWIVTAANLGGLVSQPLIDSLWDNNFGAFDKRMKMATGESSEDPARVKEDKYAESLDEEADYIEQFGHTEAAEKIRARAASFRPPKGAPVKGQDFGYTENDDGTKDLWYRSGKNITIRPAPKGISKLAMARYNQRLDTINTMKRDMDPSLYKKDASGKTVFDKEAYEKMLDEADAEAEAGSSGSKPESKKSEYDFDFDPKTRSLNPIK